MEIKEDKLRKPYIEVHIVNVDEVENELEMQFSRLLILFQVFLLQKY